MLKEKLKKSSRSREGRREGPSRRKKQPGEQSEARHGRAGPTWALIPFGRRPRRRSPHSHPKNGALDGKENPPRNLSASSFPSPRPPRAPFASSAPLAGGPDRHLGTGRPIATGAPGKAPWLRPAPGRDPAGWGGTPKGTPAAPRSSRRPPTRAVPRLPGPARPAERGKYKGGRPSPAEGSQEGRRRRGTPQGGKSWGAPGASSSVPATSSAGPAAVNKRPPTRPPPSFPTAGSGRASEPRPRGCITWSPRVKRCCQPQVHGSDPERGNRSATRRENAPV